MAEKLLHGGGGTKKSHCQWNEFRIDLRTRNLYVVCKSSDRVY